MEKEKSIKKNYIFNMLYQILLIIIPLITTPYVSRVLSPEGVGQYSYSYALITYFTILASLGFSYYSQREIAKCRGDKHLQSIVFWEINICRLIPVFLSLSINVVLIITGVYSVYKSLMIILCINIISTIFDISFLFQGNEEFGKMVIINVIIKLLGTASIFLFVKNQNDVWLYTLIHSSILIFSNLAMWPFLYKKLNKVALKELKPLRHLPGTLRLFLPNLATSLYTVLDKSLLGFITNCDAQNGYYEQAEKIVKSAMTVILALGQVMIPRNSYELSKGNYDKVKENNYKSIHFVWLLGIPMTLGLIAVADNLVPWFLSPEFMYSADLIKVFSILILIIGLSNVIGLQYMIPNKMDKKFTIAISCGAIINLICNIPLIYFWQSLGATIATIIAELTVTIVMFVIARKHISIKQTLKLATKPAIAGAIMLLCLYPLQKYLSPSVLHTLIIILVGAIIYGIAILLLKDNLVMDLIKNVKNKLFKPKATISSVASENNTSLKGIGVKTSKFEDKIDDSSSFGKRDVKPSTNFTDTSKMPKDNTNTGKHKSKTPNSSDN